MATIRMVKLDGIVYADTKQMARLLHGLMNNPKYKNRPQAILEVITEWLETADVENAKNRWVW